MLRQTIRVSLRGDVQHEVVTGPREQIQLERHYNIPSSHMSMMTTAKLEYRIYLAWLALKRDGITTDEFEAFLVELEDVELFMADPPAERMDAIVELHNAGWDPQRIATAFELRDLGVLAAWCGIYSVDRDDVGEIVDVAHVIGLVDKALEAGGAPGEATGTESPAG